MDRVHDIAPTKEPLGNGLEQNEVFADLSVSLLLLLATPDPLNRGSSLRAADFLGALTCQESPDKGLSGENGFASFEVATAVILGPQILLDHYGAFVQPGGSEILQESEHTSPEKDLGETQLVLDLLLVAGLSKGLAQDSMTHFSDLGG